MGHGGRVVCSSVLLRLLGLLSAILTTLAAPYSLTAPHSYVLLSDDLVVKFTVPWGLPGPGLRVQLVRLSDEGQQETPVVKKEVPRTSPTGKLVFPCGLLNQPGTVLFRMETIDEGKTVAKSNSVQVKWPSIRLHVPLLVETYSADVIVKMEALNVTCSARNPPEYSVTLEAQFLGPAPTPGISWFNRGVVFTQQVAGWMLQVENDITLGCSVFYRAGYYKIQVKTSLGNSVLLESETIRALWSHRYLLNVPQQAVATCEQDGGVLVVYKYPRCISDRDRIRVFGRVKSPTGEFGELQKGEYMFEVRVQKDRHSVKLPCELFPDRFAEFCFTYFSTAESKAVFELKTICRPRSFDPGGDNIRWGEWSPWTTCSATCGSGVQNRYRLCSATSDRACVPGSSVDYRICVEAPCPESTSTKTTPDPRELTLCPCGCSSDVSDFRRIIGSVRDDCTYPVIWDLLSSAPEAQLEIQVIEVSLESERQWLAARDGPSSVAKILNLVAEKSRLPVILTASHRALRVELHSHNSSLKEAGFKAIVMVKGPSAKGLILADTGSIIRVPSLSALHLTLVTLAALTALAVSAFFGIQQLRTLRKSPPPSLRTADSCGSLPYEEDGEPNARSYLLLDPATSVSEISASPMSQRRAVSMSHVPGPGTSPEDFLQNAFLFRSISSVATASPTASPKSTPAFPRRIPFSPVTGKRLIAAVSPQIQKRSKDDISHGSPVRLRKKAISKSQARLQRESSAPLTGSLSEFSINASEDGFEYDYYDYGCHNDPGSFFCADPSLLGWPPFIPIPPGMEDDDEDFPMTLFANLTKEQPIPEDTTQS